MNAAAIDLGTNSIKILIVRRDNDGHLHVLFRHRAVVRLGEGTFSKDGRTTKLSKDVQSRTLKVFQDYAKILEAYKVDVVRATGTSALREAKNGPDFVKEVRDKTGIALEVLPAAEEARLIVKGVSSEIHIPQNKVALFIDIGGGSCEISAVKKGRIEKYVSLPLGAVRLTENFLPQTKHQASDIKKLDLFILKTLKDNWPTPGLYQLGLGSAGTVRALGRIVSKTELTEDASLITSRQLDRVTDKVSKMSKKQIAALPGVDAKRAEILIAGARVLNQIFKYFHIEQMKVSQRGLREGLLIDLFEKPQRPTKNGAKEDDSFNREFIQNVARRYHSDQTHCQQVWKLASQLFDELMPVHGLNPKLKSYLMVATLLHDIGHYIGPEGHHKHTYYIIRNTDFNFLTEREKNLVATLARYHRKSPPKMEHEGFRELSLDDQKSVSGLAGILRLADGLDAPHDQSVRWIKCQWGPGHVRIGVDLKENGHLDLPTIRDKAKLFESVYKVQVFVVPLEELKFAKTPNQQIIAAK